MRALRAFLYSEQTPGSWGSTPFIEPQALSAAIAEALTRGAAALHVGFWRPETATVAALCEEWPNWLLVSDGVVGAFPPSSGIRIGLTPVGQSDGVSFNLALTGFGYDRDEPTDRAEAAGLRQPQATPVRAAAAELKGWVRRLLVSEPALAALVIDRGIVDEEAYIAKEGGLPRELRGPLGLARFNCIVGSTPSEANVLSNLHACPPWFLDVLLLDLGLTVRQENVMRENSLMCVRNLAPLGEPGLLRLKKMGQGSVRGLSILLYQALLLERGLSIVEIQEPWTMDGELSERIEVSSTKALPPSTLAVILPLYFRPRAIRNVASRLERDAAGQRDAA